MIADEDAYNYLVKENTDLNSDKEAFDGIHGIMAYNRTNQEKGKAITYLPPTEWIVAVGLHQGIVPGKVWISVQESLERNKSKTYRKPRNNEALLTGLLYCTCGSRMYPIKEIRRYAAIEELDESVLNRLISKILIGEVKKVDARRCRKSRLFITLSGKSRRLQHK